MKNKLKNVFNIIIWPIVFLLGGGLITLTFVTIFNFKVQGSMNDFEFLEYIKTSEYQNKLNDYINLNSLLIIIISFVIFIPIFYNIVKKYKISNNYKLKNICLPILFGISISLIYNILLFYLNMVLNFTNKFEINTIPIMVQIVCSGILGPILEEFLFRGIVYNRLKKICNYKTSIILSSVLFSLFHFDIINCIYAFFVSFILIYLYDKYKTLKAPIIMHMSLNITIIVMVNLITKNYVIFNLYLFVVSILVLLILKKIVKNDV